MGEEDDGRVQALRIQALSVLEKALRDAIAVAPVDEVLQQVTVMFPTKAVEIDTAQLHKSAPHSPASKVSVSMPEDLITSIRERTGPGGFSKYVTEAAQRQLRHDLLGELLEELLAEHGPIPDDLMEQARREWPDYA